MLFAGKLESQIFGTKYLLVSIPWFTAPSIARVKPDQFLRFYSPWGFKGKISCTVFRGIPLYILYISVARALKLP